MLSVEDMELMNEERRRNNLELSCRDKEKIATQKLCDLSGNVFVGTKNEGDFCDYVTEVVTLAAKRSQ